MGGFPHRAVGKTNAADGLSSIRWPKVRPWAWRMSGIGVLKATASVSSVCQTRT